MDTYHFPQHFMSPIPHTVGPWQMTHSRNVETNKEHCVIYTEDEEGKRYVVARTGNIGPHNKETWNAHMMKAAPTMYDYIYRMAAAGDDEAVAIMKIADGEA